MSGPRAAVLKALGDAARAGVPCPANRELAEMVGTSVYNVEGLMCRLNRAGVIVIEREGRTRRRVRIVATGAVTDWAGKGFAETAQEQLFTYLLALAQTGKPCPTRVEIAAALGYTPTSVGTARQQLEARGGLGCMSAPGIRGLCRSPARPGRRRLRAMRTGLRWWRLTVPGMRTGLARMIWRPG